MSAPSCSCSPSTTGARWSACSPSTSRSVPPIGSDSSRPRRWWPRRSATSSPAGPGRHGDEQLGILVDDQYGAGRSPSARDAGRGRGAGVRAQRPRGARVRARRLARPAGGRPADDGQGVGPPPCRRRRREVATQLARLREISDACAEGPVEFLLELLTPFSAAEREPARSDSSSTPPAARDRRDRTDPRSGRRSRRVEGGGCRRCGGLRRHRRGRRSRGRDDVRIVVLGAGAPQDTVDRWLVAAAAGGYDGFAVGRSIWADAVVAHDQGPLDAAAAGRRPLRVVHRHLHGRRPDVAVAHGQSGHSPSQRRSGHCGSRCRALVTDPWVVDGSGRRERSSAGPCTGWSRPRRRGSAAPGGIWAGVVSVSGSAPLPSQTWGPWPPGSSAGTLQGSIWSPTFSISRTWVTRLGFETQSDQMAAVTAGPVARRADQRLLHGSSNRDHTALEPVPDHGSSRTARYRDPR